MTFLGRLLSRQPETEERALTDWGPWGDAVILSSGVNEHTALALSAVWACQTLIADAVSSFPVGTYRKSGGTRTETTPPPWLSAPNPETLAVDYETQRVLSLLGWGNAYSLLVRQDGLHHDPSAPVRERWNLDPAQVDVRREQNTLRYYVAGQPVPFAAIQHVRGYTAPGHVKGLPVIEMARRSMSLARNAEEFGENFYDNSANPSMVLEAPQMPADMQSEVVDRMRDEFAKRYSGVDNSGKPLMLLGGTTAKQVMVDPEKAQFLETRKFQVSEIARWYRVPPHMIGDVDKSTSWGTGIEQQALGFIRFTLLPWLTRLEQADSALLGRSGEFVRYNVSGLERADLTTRYQAYQQGRLNGWLNADDIREKEDEPPLPDGKGQIYWQPLYVGELGEVVQPGLDSPEQSNAALLGGPRIEVRDGKPVVVYPLDQESDDVSTTT